MEKTTLVLVLALAVFFVMLTGCCGLDSKSPKYTNSSQVSFVDLCSLNNISDILTSETEINKEDLQLMLSVFQENLYRSMSKKEEAH